MFNYNPLARKSHMTCPIARGARKRNFFHEDELDIGINCYAIISDISIIPQSEF